MHKQQARLVAHAPYLCLLAAFLLLRVRQRLSRLTGAMLGDTIVARRDASAATFAALGVPNRDIIQRTQCFLTSSFAPAIFDATGFKVGWRLVCRNASQPFRDRSVEVISLHLSSAKDTRHGRGEPLQGGHAGEACVLKREEKEKL